MDGCEQFSGDLLMQRAGRSHIIDFTVNQLRALAVGEIHNVIDGVDVFFQEWHMGTSFLNDFISNYKMGGVSIISGTLTSVSGAFPTFVI